MDGRPNRRNKAAFSNSSAVVLTMPISVKLKNKALIKLEKKERNIKVD